MHWPKLSALPLPGRASAGGVAPGSTLPRPARRYLWLVIAAAPAVALALWWLDPGVGNRLRAEPRLLVATLLLMVLRVVLNLPVVEFGPQRKSSPATVANFAMALALPPLLASVATGLGAIVANRLLRRPWDNALFNGAQHALAVAAAALVFDALSGPGLGGPFAANPIGLLEPLPLLIVALAAVVHIGVNGALLGGILALREHRPYPAVVRQVLGQGILIEPSWLAIGTALVGLGWLDPSLALLALVPVWTLYEFGRNLTEYERQVKRLEGGVAAQARFVQDAAHELRSPLTALRGNLDLLAGDPALATSERRALVRDLQGQADRLVRLANDLLLLAQLERAAQPGANPRQRVEVDLVEVIAEAAALRPRPGGDVAGPRLELRLIEEAPIAGDPDQLRRVFLNLIENAVRHTPPDGVVRISVTLDNGWVVVEVADTGTGIDPADLPHIFERFYRGRALPPGGPGSGLGLAIVKETIVNHGGQITVDSERGRGTRFIVELPLATGALER